ncbi:hypothetical protein ACFPN4_06225, partial [Ureibacillus thermophilus]
AHNILKWAANSQTNFKNKETERMEKLIVFSIRSVFMDFLDKPQCQFGTFSKTLIPSIRMSYMVLPKSLAAEFRHFYQHQKPTVSRIDQLVVAEFMHSGYYAKHIEKMRTLYRKKRKTLLEALQTYLPAEFNIFGDTAGLHVIIQLPEWLEEKRAVELALEMGIAIDPVSKCYQTIIPHNLVMIGFGAIPIEQIQPVIKTLAKVWLHSSCEPF